MRERDTEREREKHTMLLNVQSCSHEVTAIHFKHVGRTPNSLNPKHSLYGLAVYWLNLCSCSLSGSSVPVQRVKLDSEDSNLQ